MENKKLLKFLLNDIEEIEELMEEKGEKGFDVHEIEFLQSRFAGAKKIIRIISEQENEQPANTAAPTFEEEKPVVSGDVPAMDIPVTETVDEKAVETVSEDETVIALSDEPAAEHFEPAPVEKFEGELEEVEPEPVSEAVVKNKEVELDEEEEEVSEVAKTLGDSFHKEKSLNELLINGAANLETKISNSPVSSIQSSIGINDRYQYIRELFDGSADNFTRAVSELDNLKNINEAVSYLQQNYKWKKTDTSLKFVGLVKRRFPNG